MSIARSKLLTHLSGTLPVTRILGSGRPKLDVSVLLENARSKLAKVLGEDIALVTVLSPIGCEIQANAQELERVLEYVAIEARAAMPDGGMLVVETAKVDVQEEGEAPRPCVLVAATYACEAANAEAPLADLHEPVRRLGGYLDVEVDPTPRMSLRAYFPVASAAVAT